MNLEILDRLKKSPVFAAALREVEEQELIPRREWVKQLSATPNGPKTEIAALVLREETLCAELSAARAKAREIEGQLSAVRQQTQALSSTSSDARTRLIKQLQDGADRRIGLFIMWAERAKNLGQFACFFDKPVSFEGSDDYQTMQGIANRIEGALSQNVVATTRLQEIADRCIERAHQMRLEASTTTAVTAELKMMADQVHGAYTAVTNARPLSVNYEASLL